MMGLDSYEQLRIQPWHECHCKIDGADVGPGVSCSLVRSELLDQLAGLLLKGKPVVHSQIGTLVEYKAGCLHVCKL